MPFMSDPSKNRIAIKLGSSTSTSSRPKPPSHLGKRPRSSAFAQASDSEGSDQEARHQGRHEEITGFDAGGAQTARRNNADSAETKKPYVIERQPNRDWKAEARSQHGGQARRNLLPPGARARNDRGNQAETAPADQDSGVKWGLTITEKKKAGSPVRENGTGTETGTGSSRNGHPREKEAVEQKVQPSPRHENGPSSPAAAGHHPGEKAEEARIEPSSKDQDQEALDALLGITAPTAPKVILTEDDVLQRDLQTAGEASTLADYEAMPVEEFGAALLRGMGWDGKERGAKVKEVKRRPNRMGLGAKELKGAEDLGAWDQKGVKKKRPKLSEYRREEEKRKERRRDRDRDRDDGWERGSGRGHGRTERDADRNHRNRRY